MKTYRLTLILLLVMTYSGCGDDNGETSAGAGGCPWNGNCSSIAPEGAYDCDGNTLVQCIGGSWEFVASCSSFASGGRSCTCKGGCGTSTVECSFAFDVCGGLSFETCGPNATAVVT
ncbi:MAG: hypothetical protein MJA30_38030, partial [Cytophagales bacterium]|nr:hypothetical protein [Cytophagales bacterium]